MTEASQLSWNLTQKELCERQREVLELIRAHPEGMTIEDLKREMNLDGSSISGRLTELAGLHRIKEAGTKYIIRTNRHQTCWKVAE